MLLSAGFGDTDNNGPGRADDNKVQSNASECIGTGYSEAGHLIRTRCARFIPGNETRIPLSKRGGKMVADTSAVELVPSLRNYRRT